MYGNMIRLGGSGHLDGLTVASMKAPYYVKKYTCTVIKWLLWMKYNDIFPFSAILTRRHIYNVDKNKNKNNVD